MSSLRIFLLPLAWTPYLSAPQPRILTIYVCVVFFFFAHQFQDTHMKPIQVHTQRPYLAVDEAPKNRITRDGTLAKLT